MVISHDAGLLHLCASCLHIPQAELNPGSLKGKDLIADALTVTPVGYIKMQKRSFFGDKKKGPSKSALIAALRLLLRPGRRNRKAAKEEKCLFFSIKAKFVDDRRNRRRRNKKISVVYTSQ